MNDKKKVAAVRSRYFIYAKNDKDHSNRDKVAAAWENISKEVGGNGKRL